MKDQGDLQEMSSGARTLLDETRSMDDPSRADRERVKRAMLGAIAGGGALAASTAASSTAAAAGTGVAATAATAGGISLTIKIAAVVLVAGAVGGTALVVTQPEEPAPHAVARSHEPTPVLDEPLLEPPVEATPAPGPTTDPDPVLAPDTPVEEAPELDVAVVPAPRIDRPAVRAPPVAAAPPAPSPLSAELRLLRSAQRAIAAHDGSTALRHLDELGRRFPDGVMVEEREAALVFALCENGRRDEARDAARRFLRLHPTSPLRARVASACP